MRSVSFVAGTLAALLGAGTGTDLQFGNNTSSSTDSQVASRPPGASNGGLVVPPDFHLLAASGGLTPWENIYRVEIDSLGQGDFRFAEPDDRAADAWTATASFTVSPADLADLWNTIDAQGFFTLPSPIFNPSVHDGWFADMVIRANGLTHKVKVQNFTVPQFNAVARKVNEKTPPGNDIVYNDINP